MSDKDLEMLKLLHEQLLECAGRVEFEVPLVHGPLDGHKAALVVEANGFTYHHSVMILDSAGRRVIYKVHYVKSVPVRAEFEGYLNDKS